MPSPCPCRGCKAAYEAGLLDQQWAVMAYEQGYDSGWKHGHDDGRILGYREGRRAGKDAVHDCGQHSAACCTAGYNRGYRDGYNAHAEARAYQEQVYGPYKSAPMLVTRHTTDTSFMPADEEAQRVIAENMGRYIDEQFNQHGKGENP